ncbi:MAG: TadE family protein [Acidimicrobiia bacterium]
MGRNQPPNCARRERLAARLNVRSARRARGERGAALVEMAIILPIFVILIFGLLEFGITYNSYISLRQGTREAARQAAVGNFGSTTSCSLTGLSGAPSTDMQKLMCLAKSQAGLSYSSTRVKVLSGNSDFSSAGTFTKGDSIIVCTEYPVDSAAKFISPLLGGAVLKTKTAMRIETNYSVAETGGQESALNGGDWSWCTVSSASP